MNPTPPKTTKKYQGRVHVDPAKVSKIYPLEGIQQGSATLIQLDRFRFLTNPQVGELLFRQTLTRYGKPRSSKEYQRSANETLRRLLYAGYIERIQIYQTHRLTGNVFQSAVNLLTRKGASEVQSLYDRADAGERLRWTPDLKRYTFQKIDHELEINDAAIALYRGVWALGEGFDLYEWHDDDLLERSKQLTRFNDFTPDGFGIVETPSHRLCPLFVEIDRGTEVVISQVGSTKDWKTKIERYGAYLRDRYRDDPFYASLGFAPAEMAHPIILTIAPSPGRIATMLDATDQAGGLGAYWYATRQDVYGTFGGILGPVWRKLNAAEPVSLRDHLLGQPPTTAPH